MLGSWVRRFLGIFFGGRLRNYTPAKSGETSNGGPTATSIEEFFNRPGRETLADLSNLLFLNNYMYLQVAGKATTFQEQFVKALALKRAGYEVELQLPLQRLQVISVDDQTHTVISKHANLLYRVSPDRQGWQGIFPTPGLTLNAKYERRGLSEQQRQAMEQDPDWHMFTIGDWPAAQWDVLPYIRAYREWEQSQSSSGSFGEAIGTANLGLRIFNEDTFSFVAANNAINDYRNRIQDYLVRLFDQKVSEYKLRIDSGNMPEDRLREHKQALATAMQILPFKLFTTLDRLDLSENSPMVLHSEPTVTDKGEIVPHQELISAAGQAFDRAILLVSADVGTATHELIHEWQREFSTGRRSQSYGDLFNIFVRISWENNGRNPRGGGQVNIKHFFDSSHALSNPFEDIATAGEYYVVRGDEFRDNLRKAMQQGDFALAAKYLFIKYLTLMDTDRTLFEYGVQGTGDLVTFQEVLNAMDLAAARDRNPEIKRLRGIVLEIQSIWERERASGRIVQNSTESGSPALAPDKLKGPGILSMLLPFFVPAAAPDKISSGDRGSNLGSTLLPLTLIGSGALLDFVRSGTIEPSGWTGNALGWEHSLGIIILSALFGVGIAQLWNHVLWPFVHKFAAARLHPDSPGLNDKNKQAHPLTTLPIEGGTVAEQTRIRGLLMQIAPLIPRHHVLGLKSIKIGTLFLAHGRVPIVMQNKIKINPSGSDEKDIETLIHEMGHIVHFNHPRAKLLWQSADPYPRKYQWIYHGVTIGIPVLILWSLGLLIQFRNPQIEIYMKDDFSLALNVLWVLMIPAIWARVTTGILIKKILLRIGAPFVTEYALTNPWEDFAETYLWKARKDAEFLKRAGQNPGLRRKYDAMQKIFELGSDAPCMDEPSKPTQNPKNTSHPLPKSNILLRAA